MFRVSSAQTEAGIGFGDTNRSKKACRADIYHVDTLVKPKENVERLSRGHSGTAGDIHASSGI